MKNIIKIILFNILVILTIILIYLLFFPKKSYVDTLLDEQLNPTIEETFSSNINSMKIASINYFEKNENEKVTLEELIKNELLTDLKDSNKEKCDTDSYAEKKDNKILISLKCNDKEEKVEIDLEQKEKKKMFCLYEYKKEYDDKYSEWSDWSEWSKEEKKKDELTNVETKIENESNGTTIVSKSETISIDADKYISLACPEGYIEENQRCKKKQESNTIKASLKYTCPNGYGRNGTKCYNGYSTIDATKNYYCPSNSESTEFILSGSECKTYNIKYFDTNIVEYKYTCKEGYYLSDNKCYKEIEYDEEVEDTKEVTYYRYQTRKKLDKKIDIIWSSKDNKELLDRSYNITREISCEF